MRIGIIAPNNGRPHILRLYLACLQRLRIDLGTDIPAVVVSGREDKNICVQYNTYHIEAPNNPVSNKFNLGMSFMQDKADAVMIMGSDDLISTDTFKRLVAEVEKGYDLVGVDQVYFFATDGINKGKMVLLERPDRMLGVAKIISSRVLDKVNWQPWVKERNWGLDGIAQEAIRPFVSTIKLVKGAEVYDLKSKENLNKSTFWFGKIKELQDPAKLWSILGEEETQLLKQILA